MIPKPNGGAFREAEPPAILTRSLDGQPGTRALKRLKLMFMAIAAIAFTGGILWYFARNYWPQVGISQYNYRQIQPGMTDVEVEKIIGLPPGTHRTRRPIGGITSAGNWGHTIAESGVLKRDLHEKLEAGGALRYKQWWGTYYAIGIAIDADGVVVGKYLIEIPWD